MSKDWSGVETKHELLDAVDDPMAHQRLRQVLRRILEEPHATQREIMKLYLRSGQNEIPEATFSRFLHGRTAKLPEHWFSVAVANLFEKDKWYYGSNIDHIREVRDSLYYSLVDFFSINDAAIEDTQQRASGIYKTWRKSLLLPDRYTVGMLKISMDEQTEAMKVLEETHFDAPCMQPRNDHYHGYLIRKRQTHIILTRDQATTQIKLTILPGAYREDERIHSFSGVSVGLWGMRVYALKVYMERLADAGDKATEDQLRQEINVKEETAIPPVVREILKEGGCQFS